MDQFEIKHDDTNLFKRTPIKDDVKYRRIKRATFESQLLEVLPVECDFCFHGTTIWNTEKILKTGKICAKDGENDEICVTALKNVWFTIKEFADLGNYEYPAGCIFVIQPNEDEINISKRENKINNVYFNKNPNRLIAIITTPENIERVKKWLQQSNLNIDEKVVVDYDQFLQYCKDNYIKQDKTL